MKTILSKLCDTGRGIDTEIPRNWLTQICLTDFSQVQKHVSGSIAFSTSNAGIIGHPYAKNPQRKPRKNTNKNKTRPKNPQFKSHTNMNSKWIINLNVKHKAIKLLGKNRRKSSGSRIWERVLRLDTKSLIYKRKSP